MYISLLFYKSSVHRQWNYFSLPNTLYSTLLKGYPLYLTKCSHLKIRFDNSITSISYHAYNSPSIYIFSQLYKISHKNTLVTMIKFPNCTLGLLGEDREKSFNLYIQRCNWGALMVPCNFYFHWKYVWIVPLCRSRQHEKAS